MYFGGSSHLVIHVITLLNCIFTYSASFQAAKPALDAVMDKINSTTSHAGSHNVAGITQPEWKASPNQLHLSDRKETMPLSASVVPSNATQLISSRTTPDPLPNVDNDDNEATVTGISASISQESVSVTTATGVRQSTSSDIERKRSSDSTDDTDSEEISRDIIDSYLKNLSMLPPLLPLISTLGSNESSGSPPMPQLNLPLQHSSSSSSKIRSSSNSKQQHQLSKTESAMLNYIYDQYAPNKHRHYDFRLGPHFEGAKVGGVSNVSVHLNATTYLNCKVAILQDRTVTWVQRKHNSDNLQLLTVGNHTYSADTRFSVDFQHPNNWRLKISAAALNDEGIYECQISTHPPRLYRVFLTVNAPEVMIVNEFFEPLFDTFYEAASTIQLNCVVKYITMLYSVVHWTHNGRLLNDDIVRGGISVKTNLSDEGANSTLFVARVNKSDSGNYTCTIGPTLSFTTNVHVLNESLAELYHGNAYSSTNFSFKTITSTVTSLAITTAPMMFVLIWTLYFIGCTSVR
ncbi:uncharacterized protein LOC134837585 [Culicoides brevitarsis]|uniref:uncharacterized protein LOC134837585 n=1 Tax=Culicoides brevitarsis TaxID=469753 RepID=UPI00307C0D6F